MKKIILDLCGGTGSWSMPYKEAGYDVYVITLPAYDIFETELKDGNVIFHNRKSCVTEVIKSSEVYGIFAAPTCTMFSLARTKAKTQRDFNEGMRLVKKCLEIIWYCRAQDGSKLKFWALENPMGYLRQFLGKPLFTFSPDEYGDSYSKRTDIWGYFNIPKKKPREMSEEEKIRCSVNSRILPKLPDGYVMPDGWSRQAARRSMTSKHFAEAFYKANK